MGQKDRFVDVKIRGASWAPTSFVPLGSMLCAFPQKEEVASQEVTEQGAGANE